SRREAGARPEDRDVRGPEDHAGGQVASRDETLSGDVANGQLVGCGRLDAIAQRGFDVTDRPDHLAKLLGIERRLVVGTVEGPVQGEVLLDVRGAAAD